jgi:hypothetical protein
MPASLRFNGVNSSGTQVFSFVANFDGSSHTINLPYMTVTVGGTAPFYTVNVAAATIAFVNTMSNEIDIAVAQEAFSAFTGGVYNGSAYPITNTCTSANPCVGTINNLLNITPTAIPFTVAGTQKFTIDFTQNPPAVANLSPGSGYGVFPQLVNGVYQIVISKTTTVNLSLTGNVSQMVQQTVGGSVYNSYLSNINNLAFNFFLPISSVDQQEFNSFFWAKMATEIKFFLASGAVIADIKTLLSSGRLKTSGISQVTIDPTSTFGGVVIGNQIGSSIMSIDVENAGNSSAPYQTIQFTTNIAMQTFPTAPFKIDRAASVSMILSGPGTPPTSSYTFQCQNAGGANIPSCSLSVFPIYAFNDTGKSSGNIGKVASNSFSFTIALPNTSLTGLTRISSGSQITITDGKQSIVFNMVGSFANATLTGTYYGQTIVSGSAIISAAGSLTISGSVASTANMTFANNSSISALGTLNLQ